MHKYRLISKKGEGTFSEVLKAQSIKTGKYVAIKCMKNHFDSIDQVNNLREIQALRRLSPHPNIIKLLEVLYDEPTGRLALVFELMEMNLYESIRGRRHYLPEQKVKFYMYNLMKSLDHMHRNGIFHRDIKPENVLLLEDQLKLADFGSCRGIYSKQPYTEYISTRWYRAPECLLTDGYYNYKMDIWGVGCVFFEVLSLFPLFPGTNELDQVNKIHNVLGSPPIEILNRFKKHASHMDFNFPQREGTGIDKLVPHISLEARELILMMLIYDPEERPSSRQIMKHAYFKDLRENDKRIHRAAIAMSPSQNTKKSEEEQSTQQESGSGQFNQSTKKVKHNPSLPLQPQKLPDIKNGDTKDQSKQGEGDSDPDTNLPPIKGNNYVQKNYNVYQTQYQNKKNQPKQNKYPTVKPNVSGVSGVSMHKPYQFQNYSKKYVSPYGQKIVYKPQQ